MPALRGQRRLLALLMLAWALPMPVRAEIVHGRLDPAQARAEFAVRVLLLRRLEGRFDFVQGEVLPGGRAGQFDVVVQIAAQSLSMRNAGHAEWARSAEFFDAQRHPWIRFEASGAPDSLLLTGGTLAGRLSVRGITRDTAFELLPSSCDRPGHDCPVRAEGEIDRSDFGMDARRWAVGDKVRLALSFRLQAVPGDS